MEGFVYIPNAGFFQVKRTHICVNLDPTGRYLLNDGGRWLGEVAYGETWMQEAGQLWIHKLELQGKHQQGVVYSRSVDCVRAEGAVTLFETEAFKLGNQTYGTYAEVWSLLEACGVTGCFWKAPLLPDGWSNGQPSHLSDGNISIPCHRPLRSDWRKYPHLQALQSISARDWPLLVECLEGTYFNGLIEATAARHMVQSSRQQKREEAKQRQRLEAFAKGQCLNPEQVANVAVGEYLVFSFARPDGQLCHVVDSPKYGTALYLFDEFEQAKAWATRTSSFQQARKDARVRVIHRGNWEAKVSANLAAD